MSLNPDVYRSLLEELSKINYTSLPDPFHGQLNIPSGRSRAMIHEAMVISEMEMRIEEERQLHDHSASSLTTDGGGPAAASTGPSYDPDALAWFSAVEATGNTITPTNKTVFNTAFLALKSNNIWSRITQGCFFVGIDGANPLAGAFTPFKTPSGITPTNVNFTTSDYNRLTGIIQDGGFNISGTKYIDTGILNALGEFDENPAYSLNDRHALLYNSRNDINDNYLIGSIYNAEADSNCFKFALDGSLGNSQWKLANNTNPDSYQQNVLDNNNGGRGFAGISVDNISDGLNQYIFENTVALFGSFPVNQTPSAVYLSPVNVLIAPTPTGIKRIPFYSLGTSLAGSSQLTAYGAIINTLLSSLV
jgi:hypothetical protein